MTYSVEVHTLVRLPAVPENTIFFLYVFFWLKYLGSMFKVFKRTLNIQNKCVYQSNVADPSLHCTLECNAK